MGNIGPFLPGGTKIGNNIIGGKGRYLAWIGSDSHENTYLLKSQDPHSSRQYFQLNHSKFLQRWNIKDLPEVDVG